MQPRSGVPSPEFDLVLACLRWPAGDAAGSRIRRLAQERIRWNHLLKIVHRHQVVSLVAHGIGRWASDCAPGATLAALHAGAVQNARLCFQGISELTRLHQIFQEQGIGLRVLKGAPLAVFAFGDATLRGAGDLDLLVDEQSVTAADRILRQQGYACCEPAAWLTPRRFRSYKTYQKDFSYEHPKTGATIDLHWRLFRNRRLPFNIGADGAGLAWSQIGSQKIPVLPWDHSFLYLCVHGALDGWLRAKWLADIGAMLNKFSADELGRILEQAGNRGILPEVSAALLLCRQHLGSELNLRGLLILEDPTAARITRFANQLMAANDFCPAREDIPSRAWFLNELLLHRSPAYRIELIKRSLFRPRVWQTVNLPDSLFPLYAMLSPFEWVVFRVRRVVAHVLANRRNRRRERSLKPEPNVLSRFFALAPADVALLAEAAALLTFFRIALRFFPIQWLTARMVRRSGVQQLAPGEESRRVIRRVEWAIGAVVRHAPLTFICFPQSLAAYFMLRRRRVGSKLFYGVAREEQTLIAHTWIKVGERTVVGGDAEPRFTVLAIFP